MGAWLYPPSTPSFAQESCRETWANHGQSAHGHGAHGPIHGYGRGPAEGAETGHLAERQRLSRSAYRSRGRPWAHGGCCLVRCFFGTSQKEKMVGMCQEHHHGYPRKFEVRGPHSAIPRGTTKKTWTTSTCPWYVCRMCVQVAVYHTLIWSLVYILSMKFSNMVFHLVKPIQKHPQYYQKWVVMLVKQCTATINYMLVYKTDSW